MKVNYADYIRKIDVSVLVAEAIFSELYKKEIVKSIGEIANTSSGGLRFVVIMISIMVKYHG